MTSRRHDPCVGLFVACDHQSLSGTVLTAASLSHPLYRACLHPPAVCIVRALAYSTHAHHYILYCARTSAAACRGLATQSGSDNHVRLRVCVRNHMTAFHHLLGLRSVFLLDTD